MLTLMVTLVRSIFFGKFSAGITGGWHGAIEKHYAVVENYVRRYIRVQ